MNMKPQKCLLLLKKMFGIHLLDIIKTIQHLHVHVKAFNIQENVNILNITLKIGILNLYGEMNILRNVCGLSLFQTVGMNNGVNFHL